MHFDALALTRLSSTIFGAALSVFFAWRGWGPMSLAIGALGSTVLTAMMAAYYRPRHFPWLPGVSEIRRVLSFGTKSTGTSILQTIGGGAAELLIEAIETPGAVAADLDLDARHGR